jgi:transcriptional regulator with XRE-family HTH domain
MLSDKIKQYRSDNNLTQEEFASKLFVTRNAVSKWENEKGYPNIETIKDIAQLLGISIDELLNNEEYKSISIQKEEKYISVKRFLKDTLVFALYSLVGILIPLLIFKADPTSGILYCAILGPISFIILGLITPLINKRMLNSLVAAALAITPILIYFEIDTNTVIYIWEIFYYILFIMAYCVMLMVLKINIKPIINRVCKWITLSLFIFLTATCIVLCVISFITYNESYSAPIYTQSLVYILGFCIPIFLNLILFIIFRKKDK